ncbi:MAG: hypothetical protein IJ677_01775 [Alphaproteobacteria bacterium]|nr:hypothetical protein [Alphaproteobacteria bacterium]
MQNFIIRITQENTNLLNNENIGCFILPDTVSAEFAENFIVKAKQNNKLVLASGDNALQFYKKFNLDGLILNTVKEENPRKFIENIKAQAKRAIIGAISRNRRHEAMLVSEAEPDFIIFQIWQDGLEKNLELLEWYNEFFLIQNAVWPQKEINTSDIKSDFVILDDVKYFSLAK